MADSIIRRGRDTHVNSGAPDKQYAQVKFPRVTSGSHYIYVHLPLPGVRGKTIESAVLSVPVKDAWAAQTLTATPVDEEWGPRKTTWNNQPALRGGAISAAQTAKADGERVSIDVTAHVQAVADGAKHYGWRISTNSGANNRVYGFNATQNIVNDAWKLVVDFTEAPEVPTDLAPNGGVTAVEPMLTFDFTDNGGDSTELAAVNTQVNTTASPTGAWDSGEVAAVLPEFNLATSAWPTTPVSGTTYYWRVRVKDGAGYWSGWSDWASFIYAPKPTLTINQPSGGLVWDPSPVILASINTGTIKAYRVRITKGNDRSKVVYDSGKTTGSGTTTLAHQVPFKEHGKRVLRDDKDYQLNVRVWDRNDREATSGDPTWTGVWATFHLDDDAVPTAPSGLSAVQIGDTPRVRLTWSRTGTTDAWVILRDGEVVARLDVDEVTIAGSTFSWIDPGAAPWIMHTYQVKAVDNGTKKQTTPSPEAFVTPEVAGVWLLAENVEVCLTGVEVSGLRQVDRRARYQPLNAPYSVDVVHAFEGVAGTYSGAISTTNDRDWEADRAALFAMKAAPHQEVQLVYGTVSVPVKLANVSVLPAPAFKEQTMKHDVIFDAQQTSDFEVSV